MQLIKADSDHEVIAVGSHADLIKLVHAKQSQWGFTVYIAPDDARFSTDREQIDKMIQGTKERTEYQQVQAIRQCLKDGLIGIASISEATGLSFVRVKRLRDKYSLLQVTWEAEYYNKVIKAKTARELAIKLGTSTRSVTQAKGTHRTVAGYRIRKKVRVK